jgi:hypothetical protein
VIEALVAMARGDVSRLIEVIKVAERTGLIPEKIGVIIEFIHGLINPDVAFIDVFIELIKELANVPEELAEGIGSIVDENFHSRLVRRKFKEGNPEYPSPIVAFDKGIDAICQQFGIPESLLIQMLITMARNAPGTFQRLLPMIVEYVN